MTKDETWTVVRVTERGGQAHVELGNRTHQPGWGPSFTCPIDGAPTISQKVRLTYSWGEDYAAPVTPIRHPGEIDTGAHWPVG